MVATRQLGFLEPLRGRDILAPLRSTVRAHRAEIGLIALLFAAALLVRVPRLMLVPRFQDEGVEVLWGLDITNGKALPLTGSDPYYGPLFAYLVGLTFWLFGPNILWPRLI